MKDGLQLIKERRSIRHFEKREVEDHIIKEILQMAVFAPSAHNKQPWEFIVIKNDLLKEKIANLLLENDLQNGKTSSSSTAAVIKDCPVLILVLNKYNDFPLFNTLSLGACIQNMLLAAKAHHLGSLWIGNIVKVDKDVMKLVNRGETIVSAVALGYTCEQPIMPDRNLVDAITDWR